METKLRCNSRGRLFELKFLRDARVRAGILGVALALFIGGIVLSLRQHPEVLTTAHPGYLLIVGLVAAPLAMVLNALEFAWMGRLVNLQVPFSQAVSVTVVANAANLLPLPGAAITRATGLKAAGASYRGGLAIVLFTGLTRLGVAFLYAGCWGLALSASGAGWVFLITGGGILVPAFAVAVKRTGGWGGPGRLAALKLIFIALEAARLYLCLLALDFAASFGQASVLSIAGVIGVAVAIVPAGLGVQEGVAAVLAPLVGLSPAAGFLAAALNRLAGLVVLLPAAGVLILRERPWTPARTIDPLAPP